MPDRFLEPDIVALENFLAVDSDDELLDLYVDVRLQKAQELIVYGQVGREKKETEIRITRLQDENGERRNKNSF